MTEETKNTVEKEHICPRCGLNLDMEYNPVSKEDVESYFKAALAQVPFRKTYKLFGGALEVTFEEASGRLMKLQEAVLLNEKNKVQSIGDSLDFAMLPSLVEVYRTVENNIVPKQLVYSASIEERLLILDKAQIPEAIANMPIVQLQSIRNTFGLFSKLCADLITAAQDENFWQGVGRN